MHNIIDYVSKLEIEEREGKKYVKCMIRNRQLVLQPEELVRQAYLYYLVEGLGYSSMKIAVEKGLKVNNLRRRFDIMVYDKKLEPYILVEVKSMFVDLTIDVLEQVSHYNLVYKVPFMVVTNGKDQHVFQLDETGQQYKKIEFLPSKENV